MLDPCIHFKITHTQCTNARVYIKVYTHHQKYIEKERRLFLIMIIYYLCGRVDVQRVCVAPVRSFIGGCARVLLTLRHQTKSNRKKKQKSRLLKYMWRGVAWWCE